MLARLLAGLDALGVPRTRAWPVVTKAALDSIPAIRRDVIDALSSTEGQLETSTVAEAIDYPTQTTRRALEDLTAHGIARREAGGKGKADRWQLTDFARRHYAAAQGVPEKSEVPITNAARIDDDFSGKVVAAGAQA